MKEQIMLTRYAVLEIKSQTIIAEFRDKDKADEYAQWRCAEDGLVWVAIELEAGTSGFLEDTADVP